MVKGLKFLRELKGVNIGSPTRRLLTGTATLWDLPFLTRKPKMPSTSIGRLFITSSRIEGMCLTPLLTNSIDLCIVISPALLGSCSSVRPIARPTAIISAIRSGKSSVVVACAAGSRIHECHGCPLSAETTPTEAFLDKKHVPVFLCMRGGHTIGS